MNVSSYKLDFFRTWNWNLMKLGCTIHKLGQNNSHIKPFTCFFSSRKDYMSIQSSDLENMSSITSCVWEKYSVSDSVHFYYTKHSIGIINSTNPSYQTKLPPPLPLKLTEWSSNYKQRGRRWDNPVVTEAIRTSHILFKTSMRKLLILYIKIWLKHSKKPMNPLERQNQSLNLNQH